MRQFQSYFESKNIDKDLQIEVRKYLEFKFNAENELSIQEEANILKKVPENLKINLIKSANIQYLRRVSSFKQFSNKFLEALSLKMESISFLSNDIIMEENKQAIEDPMLYFIIKGTVVILKEKDLEIKQPESTARF